jgi:IS1 family transposase
MFFLIINGCGTRAAARAPGTAKDTAAGALRSIEALLWHVNYGCLNARKDSGINIDLVPAEEVEMDETRSFAGGKSRQRRLWRAADHNTGEPPAFHFGTREYKNLSGRLRLLKPYEIKTVYSDDHFACKSRVTEARRLRASETPKRQKGTICR